MDVAMSPVQELELDTRGRLCPQPILDLAAAIRTMPEGAVIQVLSDDAAFVYDLPAWCQSTGHQLLELKSEGRRHQARVRKMHDRTF